MTCTLYLAIYQLVIFQNFPNTTRRFAARILDNFEISLAVLLLNTTTSHTVTYTLTLLYLHSNTFSDWRRTCHVSLVKTS